MFVKFATALLFKKGKYWLMPLSVIALSTFLLFEQCAAFSSIRREADTFCKGVDLWVTGERLGIDELLKVRRLNEVAQASFVSDDAKVKAAMMSIKAVKHTNIPSLKGKVQKATGLKAFTSEEFSKELFKARMKGDRTLALFSSAVISGLVLAISIFAAIFYYFFKRELVNYSVFKAVGATPTFLAALMTFQAALIAFFGWGIAFVCYMILQTTSQLFFPLSWEIVAITFIPLLVVSLGTGLFVSFKVKEVA